MSVSVKELHAMLEKDPAIIKIYEKSFDEAEGTAAAIVRKGYEKLLAVAGDKADTFTGTEENGYKLCPMTAANAPALHKLFPYTKPASHAAHRFTMGLGDRIGMASAGHVRAIAGYDVYPILAQQSIRELNLTNRTFADVIACATFGVFQEGYKGGYGADGDHLKTTEEIKYALESGCTMVTLDCSEHIKKEVAEYTDEQVEKAYAEMPADVRAHYEGIYLGKEMPVIGTISPIALKHIVVTFHDAIAHAAKCYHYINEIKTVEVDYELSIDETLTITSPEEHFVIANEMNRLGANPVSVAPHFSGYFEKAIEYKGNLDQFNKEFIVHQQIADHFGYKLSVHSGSDKFFVFPTVGRVTKGHVHVKTAGTNWLEAMRVIATYNPDLYRKAHKYAIEHRPDAERYYHVTTKVEDIPNIDLMNDAFLPHYMDLPASRQTVHIAYGMLLQEPWFHDEFFKTMLDHEEDYYNNLIGHIGRHLKYLTSSFNG